MLNDRPCVFEIFRVRLMKHITFGKVKKHYTEKYKKYKNIIKYSDISDKLEIFIVTYNRKKYLYRTLNQIFSDNSPIKNYKITILDNHSNDGTDELVHKYMNIYNNINYIVHNRNIGGNANICRAFELATYPYVWVLCDDDEYNWENWSEVEYAILNDNDMIVVSTYLSPKESIVNLIKQITFVPAAIYKTSYFSSGMMINAYYNISTMFPQLAVASVYFNKNLKIYICNKWIVNMVVNNEDASYTRGVEYVKPHPYMKNNYWQFGFATAIQLFEDPKLRENLTDNINLEPYRGYDGYCHMLSITRDLCNNNYRNLSELFFALNNRQRIEFITAVSKFYGHDTILKWIIPYVKNMPWMKDYIDSIFINDKKNNYLFNIDKNKTNAIVNILNIIKIKIWDYKWVHLRNNKKGTDIIIFNKIKIRILPKIYRQ